MKLLFDENLSPRLVALLAHDFPGSQHLRDVGFAAAPDPTVWANAAAQGFVIVSKDCDFHQRALLFGHPLRSFGFGWATAPRRQSRRCYVPDSRTCSRSRPTQ